MKTLFVSDLDGTLLNSDAMLSEYTKAAIKELVSRGVYFTIATARSPYSVNSLFESVALETPCILMNGVITYDLAHKKFIDVEAIEKHAFINVLSAIREVHLSAFVYVAHNDTLVSYYENITTAQMNSFYEERKQKYGKSFVKLSSFDEISGEKVIYLTMLYDRKTLTPLCQLLEKIDGISYTCYEDIYSDGLWYLEVFSNKATKYNATNKLREKYGFYKVIGYGDSHNDIPLIEACDEFYAVSNAVYDIKVLATGIIGDNNSDSVIKHVQSRIYI